MVDTTLKKGTLVGLEFHFSEPTTFTQAAGEWRANRNSSGPVTKLLITG
jgi:hypothetical protein